MVAKRWLMPALVGVLSVSVAWAEMATVRMGQAPKGPPSAAAKTGGRSKPPTGYIVTVDAAPQVDGKLDDAVWKKAEPLRLNRSLDGSGRAPQPTTVRVVRHGENLYVSAECVESKMKRIKARKRPHDGEIWADDDIEIFIGPGRTYYHFAVNALGSTFDAKGKGGAGWNAKGLSAAAGTTANGWAVELVVPLENITGKKVPASLKANFVRGRRAGGRLQEGAWSPTYSGESHQYRRFGTLNFGAPPKAVKAEPKPDASNAKAVTFAPVQNGESIVRFDLSKLPKGTRVVRASLLVFRKTRVTGADPAALEDIVIHPLFAEVAAGGKVETTGKALALRAPAYDRFDATEAVRQWVSGKPNGGFFVKKCPNWNAEGTCLDVTYEGKPGNVPPQATGLKVLHRAGQTFITWQEVNSLIKAEKVTWGDVKAALADPGDACRYRIYVHEKPITAQSILDASCVAEVGSLSAYNTNGRNVEYLIGQAMIKPDQMGELAGKFNGFIRTFHMNHPRMDRYPIQRFTIDGKAGPLPAGSGLYVHNAAKAGKRHYAVVSVKDGVENTKDFSAGNAQTAPVDEKVGPGQPVCQGNGLSGPFFDFPGKRKNYVQWCAPPLAPRPNMYFNWSVLTPPNLKEGEKVAAEMYFHAPGRSYAQPGKKLLLNSIQIAPHDYPSSSWYGYNDAMGTLKSFKKGTVGNHTQKRIVAFLDWAVTSMPIDPERIIATGGDGAAALAINFPESFAYVYITGFNKSGGVLNPKGAGHFSAIWGPKSADIKDDKGLANWDWAMLDGMVDRQTKDLPLFACLGGSWGVIKGYAKGRGRFYDAMARNHQSIVAGWGWSGFRNLGSTNWYTGSWRGKIIRRDMPVVAINNSSTDHDSEASGHCGAASYGWRDLKDEPESFSVTLTGRASTFDFTPRRLKAFNVKPGDKISWKTVSLPDRRGKGGGKEDAGGVVANKNGTITIPRMKMVGNGFKLTLKKMTAEKLDVDKTEVAVNAPARDVTDIVLKLRNWSNKPRQWKAAAGAPWIKPDATSGTAKSFEDLVVHLDTKTLDPAKAHTATLTITDVGAGKDYPVKITANVGKVFDAPTKYVVNVTAGGKSEQKLVIKNLSGAPLEASGQCSLAWITTGKAKAEAKSETGLTIAAAANGHKPGKYSGTLTVNADGDSREIAVTAYVLPEYKKPEVPAGESVWLSHKMPEPVKITAHTIGGRSDKRRLQKISRTFVDKKTSKKTLLTVEKVTYEHVWYVTPAHETVVSIDGAGFKAFSAEAAMKLDIFNKAPNERFCFEIYVDGEMKTSTGLIKADQLPRPMLVTGLEKAKEIRFVSRRDTGDNSRHQMIWGNPKFHK